MLSESKDQVVNHLVLCVCVCVLSVCSLTTSRSSAVTIELCRGAEWQWSERGGLEPDVELVWLLIHSEDNSGEGPWAKRTAAPGIFELDNFPISPVDYTSGDLIMAADDGDGHLYATGMAERRFHDTYLRCKAIDVNGPEARARHRAIVEHLERPGYAWKPLLPGWYGAAVPADVSEEEFARLRASAPYLVRETTDV
jgi:hypothetical protein